MNNNQSTKPKPNPDQPKPSTHRQRIAPEWEHLGILGPLIRGVVGDTILVTFKNKMPAGAQSVSMHPHGVLYDKRSEGSPYADGLPSEFFLLVWMVGNVLCVALVYCVFSLSCMLVLLLL